MKKDKGSLSKIWYILSLRSRRERKHREERERLNKIIDAEVKKIMKRSINKDIDFLNKYPVIDAHVRKASRQCSDKYTKDKPLLPLKGKRVIFTYEDNNYPRVGLADRLRGMVSIYNIVKELRKEGQKIDFSINFSHPFQLTNYLEPNKFDWQIDPSEVSYNSNQAELILAYYVMIRPVKDGLNTISENLSRYIKNRIHSSTFKQIHISTNVETMQDSPFSAPFDGLFKPSAIVQEKLDYNNKLLNSEVCSYVCATLRFQNLLGDFYEGERYVALESEDEKLDLIRRCQEQIEKIHKRHPGKRVVVTSDSRRFLDAIDELPYTHTIDGELVHMGFTSQESESIDLYLKSFVDLYMISRAEKIYRLITGKMYLTGFPETASKIYDTDFETIEF